MSDFITAKSKLADYGETITDAVKFRVRKAAGVWVGFGTQVAG